MVYEDFERTRADFEAGKLVVPCTCSSIILIAVASARPQRVLSGTARYRRHTIAREQTDGRFRLPTLNNDVREAWLHQSRTSETRFCIPSLAEGTGRPNMELAFDGVGESLLNTFTRGTGVHVRIDARSGAVAADQEMDNAVEAPRWVLASGDRLQSRAAVAIDEAVEATVAALPDVGEEREFALDRQASIPGR